MMATHNVQARLLSLGCLLLGGVGLAACEGGSASGDTADESAQQEADVGGDGGDSQSKQEGDDGADTAASDDSGGDDEKGDEKGDGGDSDGSVGEEASSGEAEGSSGGETGPTDEGSEEGETGSLDGAEGESESDTGDDPFCVDDPFEMIDPQRIFDDVAYLASPELEGRLPGTKGDELLTEFAVAAFESIGLEPAGDDGSYLQHFNTRKSPRAEHDGLVHSCGDHARAAQSLPPLGARTANILGMIRGSDPEIGHEIIVVGAHIDHLGKKGNDIYYGADDNASGSAIVLELARQFVLCGVEPRRTVLFAEFNAEEMGLIGSNYFVANPTVPLKNIIAMYNFDMVGAGDSSGVLVFGGDDEPNRWMTELLRASAAEDGLDHVIQVVPQKLATDHAAFVRAGIPATFNFSRPDPHPGYHTPADDISNIRIDSLELVAELYWSSLRRLAMGQESRLLEASESRRLLAD